MPGTSKKTKVKSTRVGALGQEALVSLAAALKVSEAEAHKRALAEGIRVLLPVDTWNALVKKHSGGEHG